MYRGTRSISVMWLFSPQNMLRHAHIEHLLFQFREQEAHARGYGSFRFAAQQRITRLTLSSVLFCCAHLFEVGFTCLTETCVSGHTHFSRYKVGEKLA